MPRRRASWWAGTDADRVARAVWRVRADGAALEWIAWNSIAAGKEPEIG
jgi:phage baseplate assembly protein gpV